MSEERADFNSSEPIPEYHYTGSQQQQIGGDGSIPDSWTTAHDNPMLPGYISLGPGPIYGEVTEVASMRFSDSGLFQGEADSSYRNWGQSRDYPPVECPWTERLSWGL